MKILYLINYAGKAGSEKYVRELAEISRQKGASVFFAYNIHGPLAEHFVQQKIPTFQINMRNPLDVKAARALAKICREHKIDIVHAQYARENYIAILAKKFGSGAQVVFTAHFHIKNNFLWRCANKIFIRANSAVIAVCTSVKNLLVQNGVSAGKIHVIVNGVTPVENPRPVPPLPFTFVVVGRLSPEKGLMFLLASVKLLAKYKDSDFKVLIAGDGEQQQQMQQYIVENGLCDYVEMMGFCTDIPAVLRRGHVYISSSQSEALSFSVLEAMAESLPVIATNVGGFPDIVNDKTNCGILVEYGNEQALSTAMQTFMNDAKLYKTFSQNAIRNIEATFNIQTMADKTFNIYTQAMTDTNTKYMKS